LPLSAPNCSYGGCGNSAWSPTGLCDKHIKLGAAAHQNDGLKAQPPKADSCKGEVPTESMTPARIWSMSQAVFEDLGDSLDPAGLRLQTVEALRAGVTTHAYRNWYLLDVEDPGLRARLVEDQRQIVLSSFVPESGLITLSQASEASRSSTDAWGRSAKASATMVGFGLRAEWALANQTGWISDANDKPYAIPYDQWQRIVTPDVIAPVEVQLRDQLGLFPVIIQDVLGRPPLIPTPIAPMPNFTVAPVDGGEDYIAAAQQAFAEAAAEQQRIAEMNEEQRQTEIARRQWEAEQRKAARRKKVNSLIDRFGITEEEYQRSENVRRQKAHYAASKAHYDRVERAYRNKDRANQGWKKPW
jgi:hypothetical protein